MGTDRRVRAKVFSRQPVPENCGCMADVAAAHKSFAVCRLGHKIGEEICLEPNDMETFTREVLASTESGFDFKGTITDMDQAVAIKEDVQKDLDALAAEPSEATQLALQSRSHVTAHEFDRANGGHVDAPASPTPAAGAASLTASEVSTEKVEAIVQQRVEEIMKTMKEKQAQDAEGVKNQRKQKSKQRREEYLATDKGKCEDVLKKVNASLKSLGPCIMDCSTPGVMDQASLDLFSNKLTTVATKLEAKKVILEDKLNHPDVEEKPWPSPEDAVNIVKLSNSANDQVKIFKYAKKRASVSECG